MPRSTAIILFARTPRIDRGSPQDLYASLPWEDIDALFSAMLEDVVESAVQIRDADVLLYRNPDDVDDAFTRRFGDRVRCLDIPDGALCEMVRQAIDFAFGRKYSRVVVLLENIPLFQPQVLRSVVHQLGHEDDCIVVIPSSDGRCLLIGMKANYSSVFEMSDVDPLGEPDVLMKRLCSKEVLMFITPPKYFLDSGKSLALLRGEIDETADTARGFPRRTHEVFKLFDRKYRTGKKAAKG